MPVIALNNRFNGIKITNPYSNIDYWYGPYKSLDEAKDIVSKNLRSIGLTVGIKLNDTINEYWWRNGIEDENLVPKGIELLQIAELLNNSGFATLDQIRDILNRLSNIVIDENTGEPVDISGFATQEQILEILDLIASLPKSLSSVDLSDYITKEDFYNYNNILSVSITLISPTLFEYVDGQIKTITGLYKVTKGSNLVVPDSITINGTSVVPLSLGMFTILHNTLGNKKVTIIAKLGEETSTVEKIVTSVRPTYYGFSLVDNNVDVNSLTKVVLGSIKTNVTLKNTVAGSYLWIVTPFNINKVAVDENFTYLVSMENPITINGLNYYRSSLLIDICELTYYIK